MTPLHTTSLLVLLSACLAIEEAEEHAPSPAISVLIRFDNQNESVEEVGGEDFSVRFFRHSNDGAFFGGVFPKSPTNLSAGFITPGMYGLS